MIASDEFIKELNANPEMGKMFFKFPLAFFGATVFRKIFHKPKGHKKVAAYKKQADIIKAWFERRPKVCVITGWKRTGKTNIASFIGSAWLEGGIRKEWPGAMLMGIDKSYLFQRRINGERLMLIGGRNLDHTESVLLKQYQELIPAGSVKEWFSRQKHSIALKDMSRAVVRTYDMKLEAWKSGAYQLVHLDEEPPLDVMQECLERTRTTKGKIIITVALDDADASWLPDACANPMKYFGTDDFMHFKLGVEDVPHEIYPDEEKRMAFAQYDGTPLEAAVRKGDFAYISGRWWPEFDRKVHVISPFPIPEGWRRWRFIDAGTAAPTACIWVAMHPKGDLFCYRELYKPGMTVDERCKTVIEMSGNERVREDGIWVERQRRERYEGTLLDHAEFHQDAVTGDDLSYSYIEGGLMVMPWTTLGQEARREITRKFLFVDKQRKHFITKEPGGPHIYFFDTCPNLIWEAGKKVVKKPSSDRASVVEKRVQNRDDHAMDCVEGACVELRWLVEDATK